MAFSGNFTGTHCEKLVLGFGVGCVLTAHLCLALASGLQVQPRSTHTSHQPLDRPSGTSQENWESSEHMRGNRQRQASI